MKSSTHQTTNRAAIRLLAAGFALLFLLSPRAVPAHCDQLDGPVIKDAQAALEKGDVTPVLKWIRAQDEAEIKHLFAKALAVRAKGEEARELADMYFFETLVRVHRAGEGEPYTGLKPAGTPLDPGVALADEALETGSADELVDEITTHAETKLREHFAHASEAKAHAAETVEQGREYVAAYVVFVHYAKGLAEAIEGHGAHQLHAAPQAQASHPEPAASMPHDHGAHHE